MHLQTKIVVLLNVWNMDDCMSKAAYMRGDVTHDELNAVWVIGCQGAKS